MTSTMRRAFMSAAIGGLILAASAALDGCAPGTTGYGQFSATGNGYYSGDVYVNGAWRNGRYQTRDYNGRSQFWVGGVWRDGQTRPSQGGNRNNGQGYRGY